MSLLADRELIDMIDAGYINALHSNVNPTSIDITLSGEVLIEQLSRQPVRLAKGESVSYKKFEFENMILRPNEFVLLCSNEVFNLPNNISGDYCTKSTMGRNGLEHMSSGWVEAEFHGQLTLEIKNDTQYHDLVLTKGMKIGQVRFFKHEPVSKERSYKKVGQYCGQMGPTIGGVLK